MSFAVVLEGLSVVAFLIVLSGGKKLREEGWRVLSLLILAGAAVQAGCMGLVVRLRSNPGFVVGWGFWQGRKGWMTDSSTGISSGKRTAVFRGLATGRIVDLLHC